MSEIDNKTKIISIRYGSIAMVARYQNCEWMYQHPITGAFCQEAYQTLYGWSDQDADTQIEWYQMVNRIISPAIYDWLDQSEDGDMILCTGDHFSYGDHI